MKKINYFLFFKHEKRCKTSKAKFEVFQTVMMNDENTIFGNFYTGVVSEKITQNPLFGENGKIAKKTFQKSFNQNV